MDNIELNEILKDKTVNRVEAGTTPGWVVLFFNNNDQKLLDRDGKPGELFLTIFVGGSKVDHKDQFHYSNCALHLRSANLNGTVWNVRDYRANMRLAMGEAL